MARYQSFTATFELMPTVTSDPLMSEISKPAHVVAVVLCGGSGTRLWPLSRNGQPKQFLSFDDGATLFEQALKRVAPLQSLTQLLVVTNEQQRFVVSAQLDAVAGLAQARLILEPEARNTAPAITLAALSAIEHDEDPVLVVLPADQLIGDSAAWQNAINQAIEQASNDAMVVLGVPAHKPHTGYGYIEKAKTAQIDDVFEVTRFIEKPDLATATRLLDSGNYLWNAGVFVVGAKLWLAAIAQHAPEISEAVTESWAHRHIDGRFVRPQASAFAAAPAISADHAVIERCPQSNIATKVVQLHSPWSDLGAWDAVWQSRAKDEHRNVTSGDVIAIDTEDCLIHSSARLVSTIGLKDVVIVETPDAVLIAHKDQTQRVKEIVSTLSQRQRVETELHRKVHRPWGWYDNIDQGPNFKVKRIKVNPGASISLQQHQHRAEHWVVVSGQAEVTCDDKVSRLGPNESTYIAKGAIHRLRNPGPQTLEIIEVQSGDYLGEDDIIRFEDQYGRSNKPGQ